MLNESQIEYSPTNDSIFTTDSNYNQIIYLDFDGATTSYNNRQIGFLIDDIIINDSGYSSEDISIIVDGLNSKFEKNIFFTIKQPTGIEEYSTIFIGTTDAFKPYGDFYGIAESIDSGNINHSDNAFVFADTTQDYKKTAAIIAHEARHIVYGTTHEGNGLAAYAACVPYITDVHRVDSENPLCENLILNEFESLEILSGGTAINTTAPEFTYVNVSSGGSAIRTNISDGTMYVSSQGTATETNLRRGSMDILANGTAANTIVDGGTMSISSQGRATGTIVSTGFVLVAPGGSAIGTTVSGGDMTISGGGVATSATVTGGNLHVLAGGTASSATILNGNLDVAENATAIMTTISGGSVKINAGGTANEAIISGGCLDVAGGEAISAAVKNGGTIMASDGGIVTGAKVSTGGNAIAGNSGTVMSTTVLNGGNLIVSSAGTATSANISANGAVVVSNKGTATNTNVFTGGSMVVEHGGIATNTTINYSGIIEILSGGTASGLNISNAIMIVSSGGSAKEFTAVGGTTIHFGIAPNTYISGTYEWEPLVITDGRICDFYLQRGNLLDVFSGGTATRTNISGGGLTVFKDGLAASTTVNGNGSMFVSSGGTATNTTLNYASMFVCSGGTAINTNVNTYGLMVISSGGTATGINTSGSMPRLFITVAPDTVINGTYNNTPFSLQDGKLDSFTILNSCRVDVVSGGTADNLVVSWGFFDVSSGGTATRTTIGHLGNMKVSEGGCVTGTVLEGTYASMCILSGATISETTVSNGTVLVSDGGKVINTNIDGGRMFVCEGGSATSAIVTQQGAIIIEENASATSMTISSGGTLTIMQGAYAIGIDAKNGAVLNLTLSSGTIISGNYDGKQIGIQNGKLTGYSVNSDCCLDIFEGCAAESAIINQYGSMYIFSKGIATGTIVSGGSMNIYSGGTAVSTMVNEGIMYIDDGGTANAIIENGGYVSAAEDANISFVSHCISGLVLSQSMSATIHSGTTAANVQVDFNGGLEVFSGGEIRDGLQIDNWADVFVHSGAKIIFNLENRTTSDDAMINNWSQINYGNDADYYLTIANDQRIGTYTLASYTYDFDQTISVIVGNTSVCGLSVGNKINHNNKDYLLSQSIYGDLQLIITPESGDDVYVSDTLNGANVTRHAYIIGNSVQFENDIIGGTIFSGIGSGAPDSKRISISGTTAKRFYACGILSGIEQEEDDHAFIRTNIMGSTFSGGTFMGANAVNSTMYADVVLFADSIASKLIMGGSNVGKQSNSAINSLTVNAYAEMILTDCISTNFCCGGSLLANECQEDRTGNTEINISGGTYDTVAGGSLFQSKATENMHSIINGDTSISISGDASIQSLVGGSVAIYVGPTRKERINGNISIFVDISQGARIEKSIYAGGACFCYVNGNADLTIIGKGNGDALTTDYIVGASGYAAGDDRYINGTTTLNFTSFRGTVKSRITFFNTYTIDGTSSVNFTNYKSDLACKDWTISADNADQVSVILSGNTLSAGKVHNIDFNNSNLDLNCDFNEGDEWTIFKVLDDNEDFQTLCNFSDTQSFQLNGEDIDWDDDELCGYSDTYQIAYRFDEEEGCGMLVASLLN